MSVWERERFRVKQKDEWCEILDSDLYDFFDNVRTDEIIEKWVKQKNQIEL